MQPMEVTERFVEACASSRRTDAQALATEEAWSVSGDSARRFFEQTTGSPLTVRPSGPLRQHRERAVLPAFIDIDDTQHTWFLLQETTAGWRVDGLADGWDTAGLYVHGTIDRLPAFAELPAADVASHWFAGFESGEALPTARAGAAAMDLLTELKSTASAVRLVRTVGIPGAYRYAAAIAFDQADGLTQTVWALLAGSDRGTVKLIGRSFAASTSQLLRDADPPWPPKNEAGAAPRYTAAEATKIFQEALKAAHAERSEATGTDSPLGGRLGDVLSDLFETLIDPDLRPEAPSASPAEERLTANLAEALQEAAQSDQIDDDLTASDLRIDSEFLRDNGGQLVSSLVSAVTGALVPPDLSMDLGQDKDSDGKRVRIDIGDLLSGLVRAPEADDTSTD